MQALGDEDGFKLLESLIKDGPQGQSALAKQAAVSEKRAGEQLKLLQALGVVERERSARGKWSVVEPGAIAAVFAAAARLGASTDSRRAAANQADGSLWEDVQSEGASRPSDGADAAGNDGD
jgi:DNA-binding IclR family transcriptional regulator